MALFRTRLALRQIFFPINYLSCYRFKSKSSYIVLLPEVPEDNGDNPLLNSAEIPNFKELSAEKCYSGVGKLCLDYETGIWAIERKAQDASLPNTFNSIINDLDKLDAPLTLGWSTVKALFIVKNDEITSSVYSKVHERARKARANKFQSKPIYEACKEIYIKDTTLSEVQKRVLRKFLLEARLNGLELAPKEKGALLEYLKKLDECKSLYQRKLQEATRRFSYRIIDKDIIRNFPETLLEKMSYNNSDYLNGPWTVTHNPIVYNEFLEYCPDKDLRFNAWRAYIMRCSTHLNKELNNSVHVEEIRSSRHDQAKVLGFETFAHMSMQTKMAGSVENVLSMITSLYTKAKKKQSEEIISLSEFASTRGFSQSLEEYDVPYWRRKQHMDIFDLKDIRNYFPFDHVWSQLLQICSNLFGIFFEEVPSGQVPTWHQDVRVFNILDASGNKLSSFFLDPYLRPNKKLQTEKDSAYMLSMQTRCETTNSVPVASLIFNFTQPSDKENSSLLSFEDVNILFQKFGHALQHLLSTVPYGQVSGLTNIEWDAVEVCSNFLLNWLYDPSVLKKISKHFESGLPLSELKIQDIIMSRLHMAGYDLCNELFLSHLDVRLHSEKTFWLEILKELWPMYKPFDLEKRYVLPCWFSPIMTDVWAGAYYSHIWSRMLAADAFSAFKECDSDEVKVVGQRFKDTFLSMGGGCHAGEVFRQFRGRDPTPEALNTALGLS